MTEADEIEAHRERMAASLAAAIQKWALGSEHAEVGDHYRLAADAALLVLAPSTAEVIAWRRRAGITWTEPR